MSTTVGSQWLFLGGLCAMGIARALFVRAQALKEYNLSSSNVGAHDADETTGLITAKPPRDVFTTYTTQPIIWPVKLAAFAYLVVVIISSIFTIIQLQGGILHDLRFWLGHGTSLTICFNVIIPPSTRSKVQADNVILLLIPYLLYFSNYPSTGFSPQWILELIVEPSLAAIAFIWATMLL